MAVWIGIEGALSNCTDAPDQGTAGAGEDDEDEDDDCDDECSEEESDPESDHEGDEAGDTNDSEWRLRDDDDDINTRSGW